jgi:hypothetical protein
VEPPGSKPNYNHLSDDADSCKEHYMYNNMIRECLQFHAHWEY